MTSGPIREQEQSLNPSPVVYLYEIDLTTARKPVNQVLRYTPYRNGQSNIGFGGQTFAYYDVRMDGLTLEAGKLPDPRLTMLCRPGDVMLTQAVVGDIRGATVTRLKTYRVHLDGQSRADSTAVRRTVMFINGMQTRVNSRLTIRLGPTYGLEGIGDRANRTLASDTCLRKYRLFNTSTGSFQYTPLQEGGCPWGNPAEQSNYPNVPDWGTALFDTSNQPVTNPAQDRCSLSAAGCMARFSRADRLQPIPIEANFRGGTRATGQC